MLLELRRFRPVAWPPLFVSRLAGSEMVAEIDAFGPLETLHFRKTGFAAAGPLIPNELADDGRRPSVRVGP